MGQVIVNGRQVITRSDIAPGRRAVTLENSVAARFGEGVSALLAHPESENLRRILQLIGSRELREEYGIEFTVSQALYYDRLKDVPDSRWTPDTATQSVIRFAEQAIIAHFAPDFVNAIREWPVARVDHLLAQFPSPTRSWVESQDGHTVELRMTPITRQSHLSSDLRTLFAVPQIVLEIPLCVYEPGDPEDAAARAFGFADFASVQAQRLVDVCHAASHARFSQVGDVLVALDPHFLTRKRELQQEGITCLAPNEFMTLIDPTGRISPYE